MTSLEKQFAEAAVREAGNDEIECRRSKSREPTEIVAEITPKYRAR